MATNCLSSTQRIWGYLLRSSLSPAFLQPVLPSAAMAVLLANTPEVVAEKPSEGDGEVRVHDTSSSNSASAIGAMSLNGTPANVSIMGLTDSKVSCSAESHTFKAIGLLHPDRNLASFSPKKFPVKENLKEVKIKVLEEVMWPLQSNNIFTQLLRE